MSLADRTGPAHGAAHIDAILACTACNMGTTGWHVIAFGPQSADWTGRPAWLTSAAFAGACIRHWREIDPLLQRHCPAIRDE